MSDGRGYFRLPQFITDVRVSPVMDACTRCGAKLPESQTAEDGGTSLLLFVQCRHCHCVFILDFADFQ